MSSLSEGLNDCLLSPNESGFDPALLVPLLRLLAKGEPVPVTELARAAGRSEQATRAALAATPETEYDEEDRIVGHGLTLRPTRHRFTVNGEELYTWCALDTLMFPVVIDSAAVIESISPTGGGTVRVTATPAGVTVAEPATAVVTGQPGGPELDPLVVLQPGALLHLARGRPAVAGGPPGRRGSPGGGCLPAGERPRRHHARPGRLRSRTHDGRPGEMALLLTAAGSTRRPSAHS